ncbi:MAG: thioesterase family protein [Candidatus Brocadiia bacterium]
MVVKSIEIRVRYAETDQMGVVYNSHFLVYFEVGRTEYLRSLGTTYRELEERGIYLAVVEAHCTYKGPARYDDLLELSTWVERLRPTRIDFAHEVRRKEDRAAVAEGQMVLACLDKEGHPRRLPPEITRAVQMADERSNGI